MSTPAPPPEILKAQELCQKADDQKANFKHFQVTLTKLEAEISEEDVLIQQCFEAKKFGAAGDKLMDSQPERKKTVKKLDSQLKTLLTTQAEISDEAVQLAQALTGELHDLKKANKDGALALKIKTNAAQARHDAAMQKQGEKHTNASALKEKAHEEALAATKAAHDESHTTKDAAHADALNGLDEKHRKTANGLEKKRKTEIQGMAEKLKEAESTHSDKILKLVTVNASFLSEVKLFVKAVKEVVSKRKDYEGIFTQMEASINDIEAQLVKFAASGHAHVPLDSVLDPVAGASKNGKVSKSKSFKN